MVVEFETVKLVDKKTNMELLALGNPNKEQDFIAQGDCLVKRVGTSGVFVKEYKEIPKTAKPVETNLVLKGLQNNHAIYFGEFEVMRDNGTTFLRVTEPCILDHVRDLKTQSRAEHHAIWIPKGDYFIDQINEYSHADEESRKVLD